MLDPTVEFILETKKSERKSVDILTVGLATIIQWRKKNWLSCYHIWHKGAKKEGNFKLSLGNHSLPKITFHPHSKFLEVRLFSPTILLLPVYSHIQRTNLQYNWNLIYIFLHIFLHTKFYYNLVDYIFSRLQKSKVCFLQVRGYAIAEK